MRFFSRKSGKFALCFCKKVFRMFHVELFAKVEKAGAGFVRNKEKPSFFVIFDRMVPVALKICLFFSFRNIPRPVVGA